MNERINEAINFAAEAHKNQMRKSEKIPYIVHPMEVATIVGRMTDDEDVMIAALLHDTVEDAEKTIEEIEAKFGNRVATLVAHETENKRPGLPSSETWQIRKEESLKALRDTDDIDVKRLWLADKLSNLRSFLPMYVEKGDDAFKIFNQSDKNKQKWYYESVLEYVSVLKDTTAYAEYSMVVKYIFEGGTK